MIDGVTKRPIPAIDPNNPDPLNSVNVTVVNTPTARSTGGRGLEQGALQQSLRRVRGLEQGRAGAWPALTSRPGAVWRGAAQPQRVRVHPCVLSQQAAG